MEINAIGNYRKDSSEQLLCPRCCLELLPIGYPGALSRRDNKTEICSSCGFEEAMNDFAKVMGKNPIDDAIESWPVALKIAEA